MKKQTVPTNFRNILTEVIIPNNTRNSFLKFPIARHEYTKKTCLYRNVTWKQLVSHLLNDIVCYVVKNNDVFFLSIKYKYQAA